MNSIRLRTTPKGDLPHYYYIFRKPDKLDTEMNNMECSSLGTILHLETQKGKEAMKTSEFLKYFEGTPACMKRISMDTKGCGKMTSNGNYFYDS